MKNINLHSLRILLYAPAYTRIAGGIESVISKLANYLDNKGHNVFILTHGDETIENPIPVYETSDSVKIFQLWITDDIVSRSKINSIINEIKPDVFVIREAVRYIFILMDSVKKLNVPIILSESFAPEIATNRFISKESRISAFTGADRINFLLPGYKKSLPKFLWDRVEIIASPVLLNSRSANTRGENGKAKYLINVGRINLEQKKQNILLEAFYELMNDFPDWKLLLIGDQSKKDDYNKLLYIIKKYQMQNRVILKTNMPQKEIFIELSKCHIFAFPSSYEGFSSSLIEAFSTKLPCVGFENALSVNEIIKDNHNGLLAEGIENPKSFAIALRKLMENNRLREKLASQAFLDAKQYEHSIILEKWEKLIKETAKIKHSILSQELDDSVSYYGALWYRFKYKNLLYDIDYEYQKKQNALKYEYDYFINMGWNDFIKYNFYKKFNFLCKKIVIKILCKLSFRKRSK